jgi:hypothetical protein
VHSRLVWALRYEENPDYLMWDLRTVSEPIPHVTGGEDEDEDEDDEEDDEEELIATMVIWKVPWRSADYGERLFGEGNEEEGHSTARSRRSERALVVGQRGNGIIRDRNRTRP